MATAKPKPRVWRAGPEKKSPGPATAAVRAKYRPVLNMRKDIANKKGGGEAEKAKMIAWKRASGYQRDWNAAKATDAANSPEKRPTTLPTTTRPDNGATDRPIAGSPTPTPTPKPASTRGADHDARVAALKAQTYNPKPKPKAKAKPKAK